MFWNAESYNISRSTRRYCGPKDDGNATFMIMFFSGRGVRRSAQVTLLVYAFVIAVTPLGADLRVSGKRHGGSEAVLLRPRDRPEPRGSAGGKTFMGRWGGVEVMS